MVDSLPLGDVSPLPQWTVKPEFPCLVPTSSDDGLKISKSSHFLCPSSAHRPYLDHGAVLSR